MKREVTRARQLPSFEVDIGAIEALLNKLEQSLARGKLQLSLTIILQNEEIKFDSAEEMRGYSDLPDSVSSFKVLMYGQNGSLLIEPAGTEQPYLSVTAKAHDEAWCAGATDIVYQFLNTNRRWYSWFRGTPLGVLALTAVVLPIVLEVVGLKSLTKLPQFDLAWGAAAVVFIALYSVRDKFFPSGVIRIRPYKNFLRTYSTELTLLIAILSLVFTVLGWFIAKNL